MAFIPPWVFVYHLYALSKTASSAWVRQIKTVTGTRATLGGEFRLAYKQGASLLTGMAGTKIHSVFIYLKTDLPLMRVMSKIAGELKNRPDSGRFICYFETAGELHSWTYEELRAIIRKK
jgi:hypothetical protein